MKYTVNRRLYDTDKAEKLVEVTKSFGVYGENPDNDWTESLYKKPSGEFFVQGNGGKNSPFADYASGTNKPGSRVTVWRIDNYNNAKLWIHDNAPDKFDDVFNRKEDSDLSITTVTLSEKAKRNLKRYSEETGLTVSEILRRYAENLYEEKE